MNIVLNKASTYRFTSFGYCLWMDRAKGKIVTGRIYIKMHHFWAVKCTKSFSTKRITYFEFQEKFVAKNVKTYKPPIKMKNSYFLQSVIQLLWTIHFTNNKYKNAELRFWFQYPIYPDIKQDAQLNREGTDWFSSNRRSEHPSPGRLSRADRRNPCHPWRTDICNYNSLS